MTEVSKETESLEIRMQKVLLDLDMEERFNQASPAKGPQNWDGYKIFIDELIAKGFSYEESETIFHRFKAAKNTEEQQ